MPSGALRNAQNQALNMPRNSRHTWSPDAMIRNKIIVLFRGSVLRNPCHVTHLAGMAAGGVLAVDALPSLNGACSEWGCEDGDVGT